MMQARCLIIVGLLFVASLGLAVQQADPGVVASVTSPVVASAQTVKVSLQTVLHARPTTSEENAAIAEYCRRWKLQPGSFRESVVSGWQICLGINRWHMPIDYSKDPKYVCDVYQEYTQNNDQAFMGRYSNVPQQQPADYSLPLGEALQPQYPQAVGWQPKVNGVLPETKVIQPIVQRCPAPVYAQTAGNGPAGRENNVSVARIVPDFTPLAWMLVWKALDHKPTPPKPPTPPGTCDENGNPIVGPGGDDLTNPTTPPCDTTVPGGTVGGMTGVPNGSSGSGNIASGNPSGPSGTLYNPGTPGTPGQPNAGSTTIGTPPGADL